MTTMSLKAAPPFTAENFEPLNLVHGFLLGGAWRLLIRRLKNPGTKALLSHSNPFEISDLEL